MHYEDMNLEVSEFVTRTEDGRRLGTFKVRVLQSPAGEMAAAEAVEVEYDDKGLQSSLGKLDRRELDAAGLIAVGRTLAALLLPIAAKDNAASVRELFARSLLKVGLDDGLRLRLRLPNDLAVIPWEYAYVERAGGEGINGFLALDPRIAIVRHEVLASASAKPLLTGDIKIITALAGAEGLPALNLDDEMKLLEEALSGLEGIQLQFCQHATLKELQPLLPGAGVFHFAGHGDFTREMGARAGTYTGVGSLAFEDERINAEQMGINLRGNGVRLAVLAGCHTGRRDGISVWSGIAPALVKAEIPAVVANQYAILDKCAIAFSHQFYQALAGGLPIERAVSAGRIAAYNTDKGGRDWGVPVLYLRAADGQLFAGASDPQVRKRCMQAAEVDVKVRASAVKAGGVLFGADVRRIVDGKLAAAVKVGTVGGKVVVVQAGKVESGTVHAQLDVDVVEAGGIATTISIGTLGRDVRGDGSDRLGGGRSSRAAERPRPNSNLKRRSAVPTTNANVKVGKVKGGKVVGTEVVHGDHVDVSSGGQPTLNTGIRGENLQIGSVTIIQGTSAQSGKGAAPEPHEHLTEEKLRLDVALPKSAVINEPFDLVIAVKQLSAPILAVADLDQVVSAEGSIFRIKEDDIVKYRIEVTGAGFQITPPSYLLRLRSGGNSQPIAFQVTSSKDGKRTLLVNAYQEDGALAAQTRFTIEIGIAITSG